MVRQFLLVALIALGSCAGLIAGARALGQAAPRPPTYLEPGDCEQPCWQGIQPGVHTREQFAHQLKARSPYSGFATDYGDGIAARFEISTYGALRLADVLRVFGPPERVGCLGWTHATAYPGRSLVTMVRLYFARGLVEVEAVRPDETLRVTPDMQVRAVRYFAPGEPSYEVNSTTAWYGFTAPPTYLECR